MMMMMMMIMMMTMMMLIMTMTMMMMTMMIVTMMMITHFRGILSRPFQFLKPTRAFYRCYPPRLPLFPLPHPHQRPPSLPLLHLLHLLVLLLQKRAAVAVNRLRRMKNPRLLPWKEICPRRLALLEV